MTVLTKTVTAALVLSIGAAPIAGVASATTIDTTTSNGSVSFANESGELALTDADNITWSNIDLSSISDFAPVASNNGTGKLQLTQTSAAPTGNYAVTVQQTGNWVNGGTDKITKADLPIKLGNSSLATGAVAAVDETVQPARGVHNIDFKSSGNGNYTLDLSTTGDLSEGINKTLTSELTWTLTDAQ
ncbi:chitinase [Leuconostoc falkenbergense]|uniref:chitinase n=1 Tax=Leuconostoc falkenbergense TaxID=2766470 RepID=UPI0024AD87B0|nr:chitinase [Leuconostoc falkenbergense]MDI6667422.1 chitinase [Leuconostoc falkenbergense]